MSWMLPGVADSTICCRPRIACYLLQLFVSLAWSKTKSRGPKFTMEINVPEELLAWATDDNVHIWGCTPRSLRRNWVSDVAI